MGIVIGILVVLLVVGIAGLLVFREAARMSDQPPAAFFDPDDAYAWVVRHLPDIVAATLTPEDVLRILGFELEHLKRQGVSANGRRPFSTGPVVVGGADTVDYILARCEATGEAYLPEQVQAVVDTQLSYLRAIGAVGPEADDEEPGGSGAADSD